MVAGVERTVEAGQGNLSAQPMGALLMAYREALPIDKAILKDVVTERAKKYCAENPFECVCAERPWKCEGCTYYNDYHWHQAETLVTLALTKVGTQDEIVLVNSLLREATERRKKFLESLEVADQPAESSHNP